jgi:hypothetical protein
MHTYVRTHALPGPIRWNLPCDSGSGNNALWVLKWCTLDAGELPMFTGTFVFEGCSVIQLANLTEFADGVPTSMLLELLQPFASTADGRHPSTYFGSSVPVTLRRTETPIGGWGFFRRNNSQPFAVWTARDPSLLLGGTATDDVMRDPVALLFPAVDAVAYPYFRCVSSSSLASQPYASCTAMIAEVSG